MDNAECERLAKKENGRNSDGPTTSEGLVVDTQPVEIPGPHPQCSHIEVRVASSCACQYQVLRAILVSSARQSRLLETGSTSLLLCSAEQCALKAELPPSVFCSGLTPCFPYVQLQFVAASNLDVATFQVSYQMKVSFHPSARAAPLAK